MRKDDRNLLEVLKRELQFLEEGGYGQLLQVPWRPPLIFEDSPSCMNCGSDEHAPCSECVLMQLVPPESRYEKIPCRHIPLNTAGETIDSLYRYGTPEELEKAVTKWLRETIEYLEKAGSQSQTDLVKKKRNSA